MLHTILQGQVVRIYASLRLGLTNLIVKTYTILHLYKVFPARCQLFTAQP